MWGIFPREQADAILPEVRHTLLRCVFRALHDPCLWYCRPCTHWMQGHRHPHYKQGRKASLRVQPVAKPVSQQ
jgi:hypothetical protein